MKSSRSDLKVTGAQLWEGDRLSFKSGDLPKEVQAYSYVDLGDAGSYSISLQEL